MFHVLTTTSKVEIPSYMIFFDSESRTDIDISDEQMQKALNGEKVEKDHELYLISACYSRLDKTGEYKDNWKDYHENQGDNFKDAFWNDVDHFVGKRKRCFMFAHNAGYDVIATGCIPALIKKGYVILAFSDSNPFFLKMAKYKDGDPEEGIERSLTIVSSTNYYQFSLAKLGECFGVPKTEIDYKDSTIEAAIPYCRNDVNILMIAIKAFIKFIQDEQLGSFALTIAGQAMKAYRSRFLKRNQIYIHKDEKALILEREAYAGGRNEAWKVGEIREHIYYVDVNSMYPYVMFSKEYPVKLLTHRRRGSIKELQQFIDKGYLIIAQVQLKADKPIYFKKAGKLIFPIGEFKTTLCTPELIRALKDGSILKIFKLNVYEKDMIFSDYVDYFYNKRLEAKAKKDEVRTLLFKLFLNSLYGKFGQKALNWERIGDAPPDIIKTETVYNTETKQMVTYKIFGGSRFVKLNEPDGKNDAYNAFPAIAAHVTANARMLLWEAIETAGEENVYYMDTDSLFVKKAGYERLQAAGLIDDKQLGKLKLEEEGDSIRINGCKDYKFNKKEKIKGVSKGSREVETGKYVSTVWRGLSRFIQTGELDHYKNEVIVKTLSRRYEKGLINTDGYILPYKFENDTNLFLKEVEERKDQIRYMIQQLKEQDQLHNKMKPPEIEIILKLKGLKHDGNGAYKEELSNFKYPYRNFKNGCSIDRATNIINWELGTNYYANDILDLLYDYTSRKTLKAEIKALEEEIAAAGIQDYYKTKGDLPF